MHLNLNQVHSRGLCCDRDCVMFITHMEWKSVWQAKHKPDKHIRNFGNPINITIEVGRLL